MSINMHLRGVPDDVHRKLQERSRASGMSLRQYTISILADQTSKPTMDEWLSQLDSLPSHGPILASKVVAEDREAGEQELLDAVDR